jgi:MYXO-CTERM domain-containing protein
VAGAGCSSTGAAGWPLLLLLAAFALRRRSKAAMAALLLCASAARAQDSATIAVDRFQPGAGAFDVLGVWSADTAQDREWHASVYGSYARDPLRLVQVDHATQVPVLQDQSLLHLGASIGLGDRFEVGAVLPLAVQSSSGTPLAQGPLSAPAPSAGIGDLRILPKARLLSIGGLVLGAAAPFSLPTGRQEAYLGAGSLTITPTALAELQEVLPVRLLANAGMAVRGSRSLGNLRVGTAITYGLAAEMPLREKLALLASIAGEVDLAGGGSVERPMEMLAALRWSASPGIDVTAGGGPGIGNGYGTPKYRMFVAVSITPSMLPARRPLPVLPLPEQTLFPAVAVAADPSPLIYQEWNTPEPVLAKLEDDKVDLLAPVLFAHNGDVILPQSRAVLDAAIAILKNHTELSRLRIEGHTDDRGKPAYNLDLSKRRGKAVRFYLVKHGIAAARLESQGYGNTRPVDTNATNDGRAHNRRVELMITQRLQTTRTAALSPP